MKMNRYEADLFDEVWVTADESWNPEAVREKALSKINGEHFPKKRGSRKRTFVVMLAAVIMAMGMASFGAERDWDIRFAEQIGVGEIMTDLPGGYKEIGVSGEIDGMTLTVSQAIGDRHSQWIQVDSSLSWEGSDAAWDVFETIDVHAYDGNDMITGGYSVGTVNCDGKLSFMVYMTGYDGINEADMELTAVTQSGEVLKLFWKNYYAANTETTRTFTKVTLREEGRTERSCIVTKIEVTPVSLTLKGWSNPLSGDFDPRKSAHFSVDSLTLEDGTVVEIKSFDVAGMKSSGMRECFLSLAGIADGSDIASITVGGVEINL